MEQLVKDKTNTALFKEWIKVIGRQTRYKFNALIFLKSNSHGSKTNFIRQLYRQLTEKFLVYYNSPVCQTYENKSPKDFFYSLPIKQTHLQNFLFANDSFTEMTKRIRLINPQFVIIDNVDKLKFSSKKINELLVLFPHTRFIIIRDVSCTYSMGLNVNVILSIHGSKYLGYKIINTPRKEVVVK